MHPPGGDDIVGDGFGCPGIRFRFRDVRFPQVVHHCTVEQGGPAAPPSFEGALGAGRPATRAAADRAARTANRAGTPLWRARALTTV
ncbi:hypothetical protein Apa02nite_032340 [Actinoplanes palleronii]|uniref:Uncharacterized protein n=1 Tax=Actinoplanes palleronii TaxID=113570 RepID=A0ABQ4B8U7_9ACTN|nr:hypothetical protein Apa02nite_032340 [Actinoplanes palleronii]